MDTGVIEKNEHVERYFIKCVIYYVQRLCSLIYQIY